jgi:hypothetical protein
MHTQLEHHRIGVIIAPICLGLLSLSGCGGPKISAGAPLTYADVGSNVTFAASSVSQTNIYNQNGVPISGLVIRDASLIRSAADLSSSTRHVFVIFADFLLGNLASGSYWRSQADKRRSLDIPVFNTVKTRVLIVTVDASKQVTQVTRVAAAHAQLGVDTNDFARVFTP